MDGYTLLQDKGRLSPPVLLALTLNLSEKFLYSFNDRQKNLHSGGVIASKARKDAKGQPPRAALGSYAGN